MRIFIMRRSYILSNASCVSLGMSIWFLSLFVLTWCITLLDLYPRDKSHWIIGSMCYLICFTNILLRICIFKFIREFGIFFFPWIFVWLLDQGNFGFIKQVWKYSLLYFLEEFRKDWRNSSKGWWNSHTKSWSLGPCVDRVFDYKSDWAC